MKIITLLAATAVTIFPATAMAQNFEGPYVGAQIGWNQDKANLPNGATATVQKRDALVGGIYAGYDHEVAKNVVLGVETGLQAGSEDQIIGAGNAYTIDQRYSFDISARAGYVINNDTLVYARGGYTNSRVRLTDSTAGLSTQDSRNLDGWFVGGGVERKLLTNVSARLEYRYHQYDLDNGQIDRHQVLAGISYRF
jgi:outer membrane immunogenic protein